MSLSRRPLVAGNWKMNGMRAALGELSVMGQGYDAALLARVELLICPPATWVFSAAVAAIGTRIAIGAQDCHANVSGAHTGDISAEMLADAGATHVILGHSERRTDHAEDNAGVKAKAEAALRAGLIAIVCVGETRAERESGKTLAVVRKQLRGSLADGANAANTVIAYEPVWAIGTGLVLTLADVAEVHADLRKTLKSLVKLEADGIRILYGGSVKPDNAKALLSVAHVDGALVGGASLKAADFMAIASAYR